MSEIQIDHEAAKNVCHARLVQGMHPSNSDRNIARALIDLHAQLAAERARVDALVKHNDQRYRDLAGLLQIWNNLCETLTNISGKNSQHIPKWNMPNDNTPSERAMNYITQLAADRERVQKLAELVRSLQAPSDSNVMKRLAAILNAQEIHNA